MKYNISSKVAQIKKSDKNYNTQATIAKSKTIFENFTNDNIFKNDIYYKMNSSLAFDSQLEEQNCRRNIFHRYFNAVTPLIIYQIITSLSHLILYWSQLSWLTALLYFPAIALLFFSLFLVNNFDKLDKNSGVIRYCLEVANLLDIIFVMTKNEEFKSFNVPIKFCYGMIYNSALGLDILQSLIFYITEFITILACLGNLDCLIYFRIFYNFFTFKGIKILLIISSIILVQFFFSKSQREIWALYDSFKRSFFNLKNIYDDFPFPVLIISKKAPNTIYYKNAEVDLLFQKRKHKKSNTNIVNSKLRKPQ